MSRQIAAFRPEIVTPTDDDVVVVGVGRAEQILGVSRSTIYRWLRDGFIAGEQLTAGSPWHLRIDAAMRAKVVAEVPEGWVDLDRAATALGAARQTVLDRIRRGELRAVHVNRGRRRGLAIEIAPQGSTRLFADAAVGVPNRVSIGPDGTMRAGKGISSGRKHQQPLGSLG